jgi:hypothetical protein
VDATNRQLTTIQLGDTPDAWAAAGFEVRDGVVELGATAVALTGTGARFEGWALSGVEHSVDGLALVDPVGPDRGTSPPSGTAHPNGIVRIDHVVVRSGDVDRTVGAFESAGLEVRGGRSTTSYGSPMRQVFLWAGDVIVELIGPDRDEPTTDEPTSIFGLALVAQDLDATAAFLGDLMSAPKDAVQPGRRIAGLRGAKVGVHLPIAVMSPHV